MWRRFRRVIINQEYFPKKDSKTVYFINHNYWWDGLLPLYLNRKLFKQHARALMEDKQMRQYPFFSRIGAFSVNLENPRSSIQSLRYAVESMKRNNSCLFIYPEGKLMPVSDSKPKFKEGLSWLYKKMEGVDFVPVAFYIDHSKANKPDLYISIGEKVNGYSLMEKPDINSLFEESVHNLLVQIKLKLNNSTNNH
ncbi:MAG: lysophospholipid acyltransferase family protein [Balneolaceae bacterium]|nr:lysophospholipid acyltransferase family protein [Balneolaceae bacterium]MBO6546303.1 lysophospholipid acyltransferase family protein [Balneolaceae bacterium]MBO6648662.1 lysophospholipid acyltransferase family protein [Balneolaceae bacterium]